MKQDLKTFYYKIFLHKKKSEIVMLCFYLMYFRETQAIW